MKVRFILIVVLLVIGLSSCQCSDKPEVGPVEEAAAVHSVN